VKAKDFTIQWIDSPRNLELHAGHVVTNYDTDWHFHQDWQIVHITAGERLFEWRYGGTTVKKGETLILPPTFVHRGHSSKKSASFVMLYVSPRLMGVAADRSPSMVRNPELTEVLAARGKKLLQHVTWIQPEASFLYGNGAEERSGEAAGPLGGGERDCDVAGARVLRTAEHGAKCGEVRSARGSDLPEVLQE
jgi:hypothetical protein